MPFNLHYWLWKTVGVSHPQTWLYPTKPSMKFASSKNLGGTPNVLENLWLEISVGIFCWIDFSIVSSGFTRVPGRPGPRCCDPSLGFCGKARVTGRDADHQQQPVGWLIGYILFLIETMTQKIPDFLVENDPIWRTRMFWKIGLGEKPPTGVLIRKSCRRQLPVTSSLASRWFFFAKILVSLVGSVRIQGIASSGAPRTWAQKRADSLNTWREWGDIHLTDGWIVWKQLLYPLVSLDLREVLYGFVAGR